MPGAYRRDLEYPMLTNSGQAPFLSTRTRIEAGEPDRSEDGLRNGILALLPGDVLARLRARLHPVELKRGRTLYERNVPLSYGYFIERGAASLLVRVAGRGTLEIDLLGRSDFIGIPLVLSTGQTPHRCVVQVSGSALRISADDLRQALREMPLLRDILLGYVQVRLSEIAQLAACNTCHTLHERLARCLLMARDRVGDCEIPLTHQALSRALGVRRASVTTAIGRMEEAGLLSRGRGRLLIANQNALEAEACECYRAIKSEYRLFACTAKNYLRSHPDRTARYALLAS
jgi:CRP-like cAMP-binding protein